MTTKQLRVGKFAIPAVRAGSPVELPGLGGGVLGRAPGGVRVGAGPVNTNAIEAADRRTDLFKRRRALMEQWAAVLAA